MHPHPRPGPRHASVRRVTGSAAVALAALGLSCSAPPPPLPPPPIDAEGLALRLEARSRLEEPARLMFDWSLAERDARFRGRGVARVEPPYRARLDLFLANGETAVRAALVEDDLRLPAGAPAGVVPPAELLWAALGVFRPPRDARFRGAERLPDSGLALRYMRPDGIELRYVLTDGAIQEVERLRDGRVVERLEIAVAGEERYPREAIYRNLGEFRELRLTRQGVGHVESYPPDIWRVAR